MFALLGKRISSRYFKETLLFKGFEGTVRALSFDNSYKCRPKRKTKFGAGACIRQCTYPIYIEPYYTSRYSLATHCVGSVAMISFVLKYLNGVARSFGRVNSSTKSLCRKRAKEPYDCRWLAQGVPDSNSAKS